ncbi:phosphatidylcholine-sterol acyltransferase, putative, partial [Plasmodium gallinaceum]
EEEVDKEEGEVDKEEGEVDKEEGEVDREEEEVDREEEEVDTKEGKVEKEAGEIDRETGEIDRETGEIEKEAGEVDREEGEVDKEEEEVEKEAGEVEKEAVEEDREEGEVDKEAGEIDRETGEIEKEAGEVDKEAAEVDREEGEVDRGEGKVDRETGEIEKEEIEVDREEGKVDRETGEIEKEAGEVEKEVGEVDRETGEIEKEAGVEKEVGEVEKEAGEIDRETGEIEKEKVDRNPRGVDKEKTELENLKLNAQIKKRIPIEEVIKQIGEKYEYVEKLKGYIKANAKKNEAYINDKYDSEISNPTTYLIPGVGGSTLIAQYKNAQINSCGKNTLNSKPFRIWLSLGRLFSIISNIYCTFDTLRLSYDEETNLYYNQKGVIIRTEKYGSLKGVDYLDYFSNTGIRLTRYFNFLSSRFISNGYVDGDSIVGAPYDWRYPLYQQNFEVLKAHIEYSYEMRKTKINLIGHSLGGLYINYFLTRKVDKEWKEKYLNCVIYMNSPFKGSFKTIRALLHGNRDMISFSLSKLAKLSISEGMMKAIGNSIGSLFDLIPYREYYEYDQIVVLMNLDSTPVDQEKIQFLIKSCGLYNQECYTKREDVKLQVFTLSNWHTLLNDELRIRYEKYSPYVDKKFSMDHGIPIYCVYSTDKKKTTEHVLFFQSPDLNKEPYLYFGEGDGTVPLESLKACNNFFNAKEAKHLQNVNHSGILHNSDAAKYIYSKAHVTYE